MKVAVMTIGPGGDQAHRDGVEELPVGEPVVIVHDALAQERHDGQAAAEDERAGLDEEPAQRQQGAAGGAEQETFPGERTQPDQRGHCGWAGSAQPAGRGVEDDHEQAGGDEQHGNFGAGDRGDDREEAADRPQSPVAAVGQPAEFVGGDGDDGHDGGGDPGEQRLYHG